MSLRAVPFAFVVTTTILLLLLVVAPASIAAQQSRPASCVSPGVRDEIGQTANHRAAIRGKLQAFGTSAVGSSLFNLGSGDTEFWWLHVGHSTSTTTQSSGPAKCNIATSSSPGGGVALSASFPLATARQLGVASGPSPLFLETYRGATLDILPDYLSFLNMPLIILGTIGRGAIDMVTRVGVFGTLYQITSTSGKDGKETFTVSPPLPQMLSTTPTPMQIFTSLVQTVANRACFSASWFRRMTTITVRDGKTGDVINLSDGTVSVAVVPLPDGASQCSDFAGGEIVQQAANAPECVARDSLAFNSAQGFVNALVRFGRNMIFQRIGDNKDMRASGDHVPTCTIDSTLHSQHDDRPLCVYTRCENLGQCRVRQPRIEVRQWLENDISVVLAFVVISFVCWFVRPIASNSAVLRWVLCAIFGIVVVFTMLILLVLNIMKDNRLGQLGLMLGVAVSGAYAATQGILFYALHLLMQAIAANTYLAAAVVIGCLISTWLAHHYFGSLIPTLVAVSCLVGQIGSLLAAFFRNRELSFILLCAVVFVRSCFVVLRAFTGLSLWPFSRSFFSTGMEDSGEPAEWFPESAKREKSHIRPLASGSVCASQRTKEARHNAFQQQGRDCTQRQLQLLQTELRRNADKYSRVLMNPNNVLSWAGATTAGDEEE